MNAPVRLIASAIPYLTGKLHRGRMGGSILPAYLRHKFLRAKGVRVLLGCGEDVHGQAIGQLIRVNGVGYLQSKSLEFLKQYETLGINFDVYVRTNQLGHRHCFQRMLRHGSRQLLQIRKVSHFQCPSCGRVTDRGVRGTCRLCGAQVLKDICQTPGCSTLSVPEGLTEALCRACNSPLKACQGQEVVLDLHRFPDQIRRWVAVACPQAMGQVERFFQDPSTRYREIGRCCLHGIPSPVSSGRTIYVWVQALAVYLTMLERTGATELQIFCGIDNCSFHTLILPTLFLAAGLQHLLPKRIHLRHYVLFKGERMSSSKAVDRTLSQMPVQAQVAVFDTFRMDTAKRSKEWSQQGLMLSNRWYENFLNLCNRAIKFLPGIKFSVRRTFLDAASLENSDFAASCSQLAKAMADYERRFTHSQGWKHGFEPSLLQELIDLIFHLEFYMPRSIANLKKQMLLKQAEGFVWSEQGGRVPTYGRK